MKLLYLNRTERTPLVSFNPDSGVFELSGRSTPEDAYQFYHPLLTWLNEYSKQPQASTVFNIQMDYFNSSTAKCLILLFKELEKIDPTLSQVNVNWSCDEEDEDMIDTFYFFDSIVKVQFNIVTYA